MKTYGLLGVLALGFLFADWASADDPANPTIPSRCTWKIHAGPMNSNCYDCLIREYGSDESRKFKLECKSRFLGTVDTVTIDVDQCLGVSNGKLVHGSGASRSCPYIGIELDGDGLLDGICKDKHENRVESRLPLGDVFIGDRIGGPRIRCAHH